MENNQGPSSWALTFVSLLLVYLDDNFSVMVLVFLCWCSASSVTGVPMHCQGWINKWPRACGQEGQTHCTSSLTSASIYYHVTLFTSPARSQGLNIDNTMKCQRVVVTASISNNGLDSGHKNMDCRQQMNAQAVAGQHNSTGKGEAFQGWGELFERGQPASFIEWTGLSCGNGAQTPLNNRSKFMGWTMTSSNEGNG